MTLPTSLTADANASGGLVLHFSYDDGPGKIVLGEDRLALDVGSNTFTWFGSKPSDTRSCRIETLRQTAGHLTMVALWSGSEGGRASFARYRIEIAPASLSIEKDDGATPGSLTFRDRYDLKKVGP